MWYVRETVRPLRLLACVALFAAGGCTMAPIAFHDGLPAWTPGPGQPEASIGYNRAYWYIGEYQGSDWYLTPGFRWGLAESPLAADIGLTSVVAKSGGEFGALLGPALGIGYQGQGVNVLVRPSAYIISIIPGIGAQWAFDDPIFFWQVSLLAGNNYQSGLTHFSGGGRIGRLGIGPVFLVDHTFGQVILRLEASYMFPRTSESVGRLLSVGLTVGGPVPQNEEESGLGDFQ